MRPSTRHYVVTTEHCFAIGGHFYNRDNYSRTAISTIYQHFLGRSLNNTEHSKAAALLFRLVHQYYQCCHMENDSYMQRIRDGKLWVVLRGNIRLTIQ
jgi:hypothetical protein